MATVYSGEVQGVSRADGTAWCRKVSGGKLTINMNPIVNKGIGGQRNVRKGVQEISLDITCVGVAKADINLFFPTIPSQTVAGFPNFLVVTDGMQWVLTTGQPQSISITVPEGADSEAEFKMVMRFVSATPAAATIVPLYNALTGYTIGDCEMALDSAAYSILSFDLGNVLNQEMIVTMDGIKAAGSKTLPDAYITKAVDGTVSFTSGMMVNATGFGGDTFTPRDIAIEMDNGVTAEHLLFTLTDWVPEAFDVPLEAENIVKFANSYIPSLGGTGSRITLT